MRRSRYLMMILAAVLLWWAVRLAPSALALASATVNFGGSLRVGGTAYVTCTAPATLTPASLRRNISQSGTAVLTCTNNMNIPVTVTVTQGTLTPTVLRPPTGTWSRTSIPLGAAGSPTATDTATLTVTTRTNTTVRSNYSQPFTTTVSAGNGLDYSKSHSVAFGVQ